MAKITPKTTTNEVLVKTMPASTKAQATKWWKGGSQEERANGLISTAAFLKDNLQYRYKQASIFSRLYSNMPIFGPVGGTFNKQLSTNSLPIDRPTMNVVQSCVDTLVSRITQARPRPVFLTDNGDYKERRLAKQLNDFIAGELYQTKAYQLAEIILRDAAVLGTGCIKIYEKDEKVAIERVLLTEILVDPNDGMYGTPRQLYQLSLVDRSVLMEMFPGHKTAVANAEQAYPETSADSAKSVSDQVMVVEGWHLKSGKDAKDGKHIIACSEGMLFEETWDKDYFPFVFLNYSPRMTGFFGQPLAEQLMGTQMEINKLLMTISQSINLVGVPRVFVEDGSKVVKAHLNNQVGAIVTYRGTKPQYEVAPCVPAEVYAQLQRLIEYAYQQSGVSALSAASQKPAGLNAAVALREYDDLQSDRFAALVKRYDHMFIDLTYQIIYLAKEIAERTGEYQSVYPNKNGTKEIDLPKAGLLKDSFVIQCFDSSALPRDPAGRMQKITELIQAGMIDVREGRRLLDYPDLEQNERLENSSEERILQILDQIVEDGLYTPPDPFMDLALAKKLSVQYYNLYMSAALEPDKAEMLRMFNSQVQALMMAAMPPAPVGAPAGAPLATPEALPTSPLLPQLPPGI
jgi:hypothetical protein